MEYTIKTLENQRAGLERNLALGTEARDRLKKELREADHLLEDIREHLSEIITSIEILRRGK